MYRPSVRPACAAFSLILSGGALTVVAAPLCAQRLPYEQGDRVRIAHHDSAAAGAWRAGVVLWPARNHVVLRMPGQRPVEFVPLGGPLRVQVQRGRHSKSTLVTVVGGVVGAALGATVLRSSFDVWRLGETEAAATGVVLYGFIGGALGGLIGSGIGPAKWVDVPVVNGRAPVAPLTVPLAEPRFITDLYRWERFPPTVPDFEAFFRAHADSLDPLEGIWARVGAVPSLAIVRQRGLEGYAYAGFLTALFPDRTLSTNDGLMIMGLTAPDPDGFLDLRFRSGARRVPAELSDDVLMMRPVGGQPERWVRVVP